MNLKFYYCVLLSLVITQNCLAQSKAEEKCKTFTVRTKRETKKYDIHFIVGGELTIDEEFPHMVALGYGDLTSPEFLCGGSLISDQYVLTAAHCTNLNARGAIKMIRAGSRTLTAKNGKYIDVEVITITNHPQYKPPSSYNDIALLKLKSKVAFSSNILPACLHLRKEFGNAETSMTALGWGKIDFAGPASDNLQKVALQYAPYKKCSASYTGAAIEKLPNGIRDDIQVCAGGTVGKDTCQGDSGGPLGYKFSGFHYIAGVTSFGKACGIAGAPGVYSRVSAYLPWIESIVWP